MEQSSRLCPGIHREVSAHLGVSELKPESDVGANSPWVASWNCGCASGSRLEEQRIPYRPLSVLQEKAVE